MDRPRPNPTAPAHPLPTLMARLREEAVLMQNAAVRALIGLGYIHLILTATPVFGSWAIPLVSLLVLVAIWGSTPHGLRWQMRLLAIILRSCRALIMPERD